MPSTPEITSIITAVCAVISIPISIWAILVTKKNSEDIKKTEKKIMSITMNGNTVYGSGTMVNFEGNNQ